METSNPDKIMFPERGLTKADLVGYYQTVAELMLPMLSARPLTLHRFPGGVGGKGFMQKNAGKHFPASIQRFEVPKQDGGVTSYPVVTEPTDIPWLANQGTVAFHIWLFTVNGGVGDRWLVLDLDPPARLQTAGETAESAVTQVGLAVSKVLADFSLSSIPVVTGSKGLHIWIPVAGGSSDRLATANRALAGLVVDRVPDLATTEFLKRERKGRVFVDWLRANRGATVVAPLSVRATATASVAVPVDWEELVSVRPDQWTLTDAVELAARPTLLDRAEPFGPDDAIGEPVIDAIVAAARQAGVDLDTPFDRFGRKR